MSNGMTSVYRNILVLHDFIALESQAKQGRIHGIRCYETPFSAAEEKAFWTYGWTDGPTDGRTDPLVEVLRST